MLILKIDTRRIIDAASFHDVLQETFGFPDTYGRNLDALADSLTHLDDPSAKMSAVNVSSGEHVTLVLNYAEAFSLKRPVLWEQLLDVVAFVNWRRIEKNQSPVICLAYHRH
ncbi:barstar family protein [Zavarzinella formosa]|uniref:barstar family protein n=1 Tax=Zavarzinella formosa TaxID=360055 RepID=UPI0002FA30BC|nr:barstar family protein [Zavarzinella formosa]